MRVHETAFVVSTYRSLHPDISQDTYAHLWNNAATDQLLPDIFKKVSPHEALMHSIRNRYFYTHLNAFFAIHQEGTLLNFGSGFSMYQFQLPAYVKTIEIDKKTILEHKKEKVDEWMHNGTLPMRDITYVSIDFNKQTADQMYEMIAPHIKITPIFILIEGVLFFLDIPTIQKLFSMFNLVLNPGDVVGSVSYEPTVTTTKVYQRLLSYFDSNNHTNDHFIHQTIPDRFYKDLKGFDIKEKTDEFEELKKILPKTDIKQPSDVLNESLYILEKTTSNN